VAAVCLLALSPLQAQRTTPAAGSDSVFVAQPVTKYGILRTHLPDSEGAAQVSVSHARYIANFGTRDGVKPGAIFQVYRGATSVGLLRVEWVYRDSSSLRLVNLDRKLDPESPEPIRRGYALFPHHVLLESVNFSSGKPDFSQGMTRTPALRGALHPHLRRFSRHRGGTHGQHRRQGEKCGSVT
jgi:hypothetical protein